MRSNILTIMRKEFARFFLDKRLVFTTLIMPGLFIFVVYSFIGRAVVSMQIIPDLTLNTDFEIYAVNLPSTIERAAQKYDLYFSHDFYDPETIKQRIIEQEDDALVIFPADFDALVNRYNPRLGAPAPNIEIYYNSSSETSLAAYQRLTDALDGYEYSITNKFDINRGDGVWDLTEGESPPENALASFLPMLLLLMIFSGCTSIAPESIAGEKERGTIATLLVTPIKKSELAAGKILSLGVMALLCGMSATTGLLLSLNGIMSRTMTSVNISRYNAADYLFLLLVILSTVILDVALISIISAFAKSVKEAATTTVPLIFINTLIGASAMMSNGVNPEFYYYLIPLYNSVQCMEGIFAYGYDITNTLLTVAVNIAFSCLGGFVLAKMFASEKIIYNK